MKKLSLFTTITTFLTFVSIGSAQTFIKTAGLAGDTAFSYEYRDANNLLLAELNVNVTGHNGVTISPASARLGFSGSEPSGDEVAVMLLEFNDSLSGTFNYDLQTFNGYNPSYVAGFIGSQTAIIQSDTPWTYNGAKDGNTGNGVNGLPAAIQNIQIGDAIPNTPFDVDNASFGYYTSELSHSYTLTSDYGGGGFVGGVYYAMVTNPIPEPTSVSLLAIGGIGLLMRRKR